MDIYTQAEAKVTQNLVDAGETQAHRPFDTLTLFHLQCLCIFMTRCFSIYTCLDVIGIFGVRKPVL